MWGTLACIATVPAGTGITLTVRVGDSPTPDARWSAWVTLGSSPADLDRGNNRAVLRVTDTASLYAEQQFLVGPVRVYRRWCARTGTEQKHQRSSFTQYHE